MTGFARLVARLKSDAIEDNLSAGCWSLYRPAESKFFPVAQMLIDFKIMTSCWNCGMSTSNHHLRRCDNDF